jgi:hypothetical protein
MTDAPFVLLPLRPLGCSQFMVRFRFDDDPMVLRRYAPNLEKAEAYRDWLLGRYQGAVLDLEIVAL